MKTGLANCYTVKKICPNCDCEVHLRIISGVPWWEAHMQCQSDDKIDDPYCPNCEHEFTRSDVF